jgi:hypothetical protein
MTTCQQTIVSRSGALAGHYGHRCERPATEGDLCARHRRAAKAAETRARIAEAPASEEEMRRYVTLLGSIGEQAGRIQAVSAQLFLPESVEPYVLGREVTEANATLLRAARAVYEAGQALRLVRAFSDQVLDRQREEIEADEIAELRQGEAPAVGEADG